MSEIQYFTSLGVGGVLAGAVLFFHNKFISRFIEQEANKTDVLVRLVERVTEVLTEVSAAVSALHRRLDIMESREKKRNGNLD